MTLEDVRPREPWAELKAHVSEAFRYPLDILVWGPARDDLLEYTKRCEIRDALNKDGHSAIFSEDLVPEGAEELDPLDLERLQVDAAHLIVVLYGSRGTQTEIDKLLQSDSAMSKAAIFINVEQYARVKSSVSRGSWEKLARRANGLAEYTDDELRRCEVVTKAVGLARKARAAAYLAELERRS